jgi:beta-mannosidase
MSVPHRWVMAEVALWLISVLPSCVLGASVALRDHPIVSGFNNETIYLDSPSDGAGLSQAATGWHANNSAGLCIRATVPGDLLSDLQREQLIDDPLWERTFQTNPLAMYASQAWTYATSFHLPSIPLPKLLASSKSKDQQRNKVWLLVLDGVKMGAVVRLNGKEIARASNQFLRYVVPFHVETHLQMDNNNIAPAVTSHALRFDFGDGSVDEEGRFMACSGGWDWAPYSRTTGLLHFIVDKGVSNQDCLRL